MKGVVTAPLTWQLRIVTAVASEVGCPTRIRRTRRLIGGQRTTKTDRQVLLDGDEAVASAAAAKIERLFGDLNTKSEAYVRGLATSNPTERKLARRAWLEREARRIALNLTGGKGSNGRTRPTP